MPVSRSKEQIATRLLLFAPLSGLLLPPRVLLDPEGKQATHGCPPSLASPLSLSPSRVHKTQTTRSKKKKSTTNDERNPRPQKDTYYTTNTLLLLLTYDDAQTNENNLEVDCQSFLEGRGEDRKERRRRREGGKGQDGRMEVQERESRREEAVREASGGLS
ncbi:hypothetical protein BDY24DRAFT_132536 [Mrakia frigida]|uniref:uncharacterized protein n=1 Tax=Mrakia frigida TaxID=29902 RepID=UPI003FCC189F